MEQPTNMVVVDGPGVVIEPDAIDQLSRVARFADCVRAVGMPDLHPGPGIPIGAVVALRTVDPSLVGGDAGCGVRMVVHDRIKASGDALERRILEATDGPALPDVDLEAALDAVWHHGPAGLAGIAGVPDDLAEIAATIPRDLPLDRPVPEEMRVLADAFGTIGGGNHFLELSKVGEIIDREAARRLNLGRGSYVVLAHSGSRGLGRILALRWPSVTTETVGAYLTELEGVVRFARANRMVLTHRMSRAVGMSRRVAGVLDLVHNTVIPGDVDGPAWIHRKGAAPANADELTVVLGSRGAPSWLLCGAGCDGTLCSVAHGAGRRITRGDAKGRIRARYKRTELTRTDLGSRVICDEPDLLYEEHPDVYKPIEGVVDAVEAWGIARRVASLVPVVTVKR